jgi:hypothetical protein
MAKAITRNVKVKEFTEMYGGEFVEKEVKEQVVREVVKSCDRHTRKYGFRKMGVKELDRGR